MRIHKSRVCCVERSGAVLSWYGVYKQPPPHSLSINSVDDSEDVVYVRVWIAKRGPCAEFGVF